MLGLLLISGLVGHSATLMVTNQGWLTVDGVMAMAVTNNPPGDTNYLPQGLPQPGPIAEAITPDIQALADELQDNPILIYNYVHDHIRQVLYFGSVKGAELTLLEKSGNDFDQCALLVALLRAAGFANAGYQFGWQALPVDSTNHLDIRHWLGLTLVNNNWNGITKEYFQSLFQSERGCPIYQYSWTDTNMWAIQRVWVNVTVGGTNYNLDPAFKVSEPIAGLASLASAMGYSSNALMAIAGGNTYGNYTTTFYTSNLNEAAIRGTLAGYTTNLLNFIQSNSPNASVEQIGRAHV